MIGFAV